MAIKRANQNTVLDIEEVAKKFYEAKSIADEQTKIVKQMSEVLKQYAVDHPEKWEGNTFHIDSHVRVERRNTLKGDYDKELLTDKWLTKFIDYGGSDYIDVKFDDQMMSVAAPDLLFRLLDEIGYTAHVAETLAVYKQK